MDKQQVLEFLLNEVKRLNEEEHIMDLAKVGRFEELKDITCKYPKEVLDSIRDQWENDDYYKVENFPKGSCLALAIWLHNAPKGIDETFLFEDDGICFADKLAEEAGVWGKSIAYCMEEDNLNHIPNEAFYRDMYANQYGLYNNRRHRRVIFTKG